MTNPLSEAGTSVEVDLLPCPFCGQPAHEEYDPTVSNCMFEIGCPDNWTSKGTCNVGPAAIGTTYEEAVEAWNRRALIQPTPAETAGVRRVVPQHHWDERDGELEHTVSYSPPIGDGEGPKPVAWVNPKWLAQLAAGRDVMDASLWINQSVRGTLTPLYPASAIEALRAERNHHDARAFALAHDRDNCVRRAEKAEAKVSTLSRQLEEAYEVCAKAAEEHLRVEQQVAARSNLVGYAAEFYGAAKHTVPAAIRRAKVTGRAKS